MRLSHHLQPRGLACFILVVSFYSAFASFPFSAFLLSCFLFLLVAFFPLFFMFAFTCRGSSFFFPLLLSLLAPVRGRGGLLPVAPNSPGSPSPPAALHPFCQSIHSSVSPSSDLETATGERAHTKPTAQSNTARADALNAQAKHFLSLQAWSLCIYVSFPPFAMRCFFSSLVRFSPLAPVSVPLSFLSSCFSSSLCLFLLPFLFLFFLLSSPPCSLPVPPPVDPCPGPFWPRLNV